MCLATTTLLDTPGSDGPSNPPRRRTPIGHVTGSERFDTRSESWYRLQSATHVTLTELPKLSSSNIPVFISGRTKDERRAKAETDSNVSTIRTLVVSAKEAKASTLAAEHLERVLNTRTSSQLKIYDYYYDEDLDESANAYQAHNDPVDPGIDDGEEAPDYDEDEENDTLSSYIALDDDTVYEAAELDAIALLADTWNDDLDPKVSAQLVKQKVKTKERARADSLFDRPICRWRTVDDA